MQKRAFKGSFSVSRTHYGRTADTIQKGYSPLKPYTKPVIRKTNDKQWYIEFSYKVPPELWGFYPRKTKRIKKYGDINYYSGEEREKNAEVLRSDWEYALKILRYNPFEEELAKLGYVQEKETLIEKKEESVKHLSTADIRKSTPIYQAFNKFIDSRNSRTDNQNSMSTYRGTVKWVQVYFEQQGRLSDPVNSISRLDISEALTLAKKTRGWGNTTYNNEVTNVMTLFNWFAAEEYVSKNPAQGTLEKLKTSKSIHKWYQREEAAAVKAELLRQEKFTVYRACQFTYFLCIRSKIELMKLKVGDIDRTLKRIHFSADLSKNNEECYRDYPPEFEKVLDEMEINNFPSNYYVFGKHGEVSPYPCHKDYLAKEFRPVRDKLELSDKYTIYGWKHTRTIHEMMKKADPYQIQHMLRHSDIKTTMEYMRDFDINLSNIYNAEDLTF